MKAQSPFAGHVADTLWVGLFAEHGGAAFRHDCYNLGNLGPGDVPVDGARRHCRQEHADGVQRALQNNQVRASLNSTNVNKRQAQ